MNDKRSELAKNMERFRENKKMSKADLARESGVSRPSISQYESGLRRPKMDAIRRIAAALRVSPAQLDPYGIHEFYHAEEIDPVVLAEETFTEYSADVYDDLIKWLRNEMTPPKAKTAVLDIAEAWGFISLRLKSALNALSTASLPGCIGHGNAG
jgi:transcriptional regulator with XRE-family HTH domain